MTFRKGLAMIHQAVANLVLGRRLVERTAANNRAADARLTDLERCVDDVCTRTLETAKSLGVDWGAQAEHVARVSAETGLEHHLPVEIDRQRPPPEETAGVDDCCPDTPQPRQKDLP